MVASLLRDRQIGASEEAGQPFIRTVERSGWALWWIRLQKYPRPIYGILH
jgi:hypothetical protein